jgi:hypothetical protein
MWLEGNGSHSSGMVDAISDAFVGLSHRTPSTDSLLFAQPVVVDVPTPPVAVSLTPPSMLTGWDDAALFGEPDVFRTVTPAVELRRTTTDSSATSNDEEFKSATSTPQAYVGVPVSMPDPPAVVPDAAAKGSTKKRKGNKAKSRR